MGLEFVSTEALYSVDKDMYMIRLQVDISDTSIYAVFEQRQSAQEVAKALRDLADKVDGCE